MPYSFTQIEEDKSKTIGLVFFSLIIFYFLSLWFIAAIVKSYFGYQSLSVRGSFHFIPLNLSQTFVTLGFAVVIGYAHWQYTTFNLINKMLGVLNAQPLNPNDTYHQMLQNIVEEVSVATGGRKMEAVVIPTIAMNAFAIADFSGRAVIGVTEGILARLTRAQIETVVGHEAAHIVTGDCLTTTVTTSLFELYSGLLKNRELALRTGVRGHSSVRVRGGRGSGSAVAFLLIVFILLYTTRLLSQWVRLFISRQREYRADAIAVRLTQDPLSLAEALYVIKCHWRGNGLPAQELETIFTVNPTYSSLDERNGRWAEMFATHPPMKKRLAVLLDVAYSDTKSLIEEVEQKSQRSRIQVPEINVASAQWVVNKDGTWQGPFTLIQLTILGWLKSDTWVKRVGETDIKMAYEDTEISGVIGTTKDRATTCAFQCPKCKIPLNLITYEGTETYKCSFCRGTLVRENDIKRIIIRQEVGFSDRIKKMAEGIQEEEKLGGLTVINRDPKMLFVCPRCQHIRAKMMHMFYTQVYRVEIDKCFICGLLWFDGDELEVLQYLIEQPVPIRTA